MFRFRAWSRFGAVVAAALSLAACVSVRLPPPAPTHEGREASGTMRPYQVGGHWYYPQEQPHYDEVGYASWYGDGYGCRETADGEPMDPHALTGAHKTLPLPSMVEVENLENGRRIKVRINDRGPFAPQRIIDLSHAAAEKLGFFGQGTAKVRVRYLGPAEPKPSLHEASWGGAGGCK